MIGLLIGLQPRGLGLMLVWAVIVSAVLTVSAWRRFGILTAATVTLAVALGLVVWQALALGPLMRPGSQLIASSFVIVPSVILLGVSRLNWLARRSWLLLLIGPIAFYLGYAGTCICASLALRALTRT